MPAPAITRCSCSISSVIWNAAPFVPAIFTAPTDGTLYQAGSWTKPRRVIAKVEWHLGELYPRVGFVVTNMSRPAERVVAFYNKRGTFEQLDQGRQRRDQADAAVVPDVRRQCCAAPASRAR
jgi:hypothetical protein